MLKVQPSGVSEIGNPGLGGGDGLASQEILAEGGVKNLAIHLGQGGGGEICSRITH